MLTEVTEGIDIKVSSRTAMVNSLTDGSTETFWESGDEDRGKMKLITIQICPETAGFLPRIVCMYVDNSRDMGVSCSFFFVLGNFFNVLCICQIKSRGNI
jgi:E3 ubiquitin-protein ligase MYCBP2